MLPKVAPHLGRPHVSPLISRRSFFSQVAVLALGAAGVWWLRDNVIWPAPKISFTGGKPSSGWLSFSPNLPRVVILDAQLNGRPVRALLDSGAQSSVVDRTLAQRLALPQSPIAPVVAFGVSGGPQIGRSAAMDVSVGDLQLAGLRAAVLDLASISAASGRPFQLILGQDVLRLVVADIDFPGSRVAFHDPSTHTPPPEARPSPSRTDGRELLVPIEVEGRPIEVVLDTGASGALALSPTSAETLALLDGRDVRAAPSITFGGVAQDRVVRAEVVTFAGVNVPDVEVHIYQPARGARVPAGLLGAEVLERFRVIIDLGRGRLHVIEGPPPQRRRRRRRIRS